uniref:Ribosomal protein S9 n=1 Tax=Strombidium rassoulzadegani TaxID=1082188 RepID=A0A7S3FVD1_9SPIT|mmetsp:Transcript_11226/g.18896  ORF Transcript_11226/g.18896 Transcript_11226/m.18896 type:complete len:197 (+) Transcript_11226:698-1288(+)
MKQDPFFKHYIYNNIRHYAEEEDDFNLNYANKMREKLDIYDHAKFDKLNLFDFRRNMPRKVKEAKIDSKMQAYGYGFRKTAKAIAMVRPGTGRIYVNGKPLLSSLFLQTQRHRILMPLTITHYTCLLDVHLNVWGGGCNGQVEAILPALSKAILAFDINTGKALRTFKLMRYDIRQVERKKIGKQKARKGNVYRRR